MDKFSSLPAELADIILSYLPLDQLLVLQRVNARLWKYCQRFLLRLLQQELQDAAIVSFIHNLKPQKRVPRYPNGEWLRGINYRPRKLGIVPRMECYRTFEIPARISGTSDIKCFPNSAQEDPRIKQAIPVGQMLKILEAKRVRLFAPRPKRYEIFSLETPPPQLPENIYIYTPGDAPSWAMHLINDNHVKPFREG